MHYDGSLASNGQQFDSSRKRGRPFEFKVGAGQVIKGWDLGLLDMCPGEKRQFGPVPAGNSTPGAAEANGRRFRDFTGTLTIPADLGYGSRGAGGLIPGGATLIFETELLEIVRAVPPPGQFELSFSKSARADQTVCPPPPPQKNRKAGKDEL